ncbi:uncharacterized protein LOC131166376 isoform X2 [Malania oleifera]|uniref:uncharacterized protein LOC131166376 isoform X2 n=1 Tax=Malania oleifera TaxID=397392 RepID=UPI0025ADB6A9|nr:uncharacterized protein LOC131166376 isoform X2 [Malania oleifera]
MSEKNPRTPNDPLIPLPFSSVEMDTRQLIDSLTSHISLYHFSSPNHNPNSDPNPRSSILKWFSSLTVHQRQAHLTTVEPNFIQLLLCMQSKLRTHGHGFFFILPDLPSRNRPFLPSLCYRKSQGLLARVSEGNGLERSVYESVRLFGSREGENANECCCSLKGLDSMTVCEDFVVNVDRFVAVMDGVSNGGFLRGEATELGADWVEMKWLKAKGYYSIESFLANRLEVALRLAWLNCSSGKKRGVKLQEKVNATGMAVNVFWRKKGCLDWWGKLDGAIKRKVFRTVLGKAAKSLTDETLKGANSALEDEMWAFSVGMEQPLRYNSFVSSQRTITAPSADVEFGSTIAPASVSGKITPLPQIFNGLLVLWDILTMLLSCQHSEYDKEKLFFSTLGSVSTISDCVLRKLRTFLMVISLDCTKIELLGEGTSKCPPNKMKENSGAGSRRKKRKTRNMKRVNPVSAFQGDNLTRCEPLEGQGRCLAQAEIVDFAESNNMACIHQGKNVCREALSSAVKMEHAQCLVEENVQTAARKNRKGRTKNKNGNLIDPLEKNNEMKTREVSSFSDGSQVEAGKSHCVSDSSVVQSLPNSDATIRTNLERNLSLCNSTSGTTQDDAAQSIQGDPVLGSTRSRCHASLEWDQFTNSVIEEQTVSRSSGASHAAQSIQGDFVLGSTRSGCHASLECNQFTGSVIEKQTISSRSSGGSHADTEWDKFRYSDIENHTTTPSTETLSCRVDCNRTPHVVPVMEHDSVVTDEDNFSDPGQLNENGAKSIITVDPIKATGTEEESKPIPGQESENLCSSELANSVGRPSYEWPSVSCVAPIHFPSVNSHLPAATDRLHLDVGHNWHNHFRRAFLPAMHQTRNPQIEGGCGRILSRQLPMSLDWPPMVRHVSGLAPSMTCNFDSGFASRRKSSFWQGFTTHGLQINATATEEERKYSGDFADLSDRTNSQDLVDELDSHWVSEEEFEVHAVSGMDYNQYFGGGVMYWNPSDHTGTSFSRPPSLSSDDSSWAWREADMNRAVDDMVAFSSSYSTNGLTSPTAGSFCSPFDTLASGHQALGYVMSGNEAANKVLHTSSTMSDAVAEEKVSGSLTNLSGDVEGNSGDSFPYPILRPIIVPNMSRERSRSEFKRSQGHKSPCVPPSRREQPRIKRPPSPVVLCVPQAPRPPPPSPVGESRKHRGFSTVRSGSSSPRHWGVRGWYQDGTTFEEACVCMDGAEVVWPSWRNRSISVHPIIQPLPGTLLQDRLIAISQLARDQEHPDVALPLQPPELLNCPLRKASLSLMHSRLHDEIDSFCKKVSAENMIRKPYINWAVKRVARSLQVLWPRSRTNIFGSNATGLSLPTSDVDLVVCLPPVRNLEPIKEAGILEGRNGIKETCLQHAARYLANQEWVTNDSLKTVENTAIPIIRLVVEVPHDFITPGASNLQTPRDVPAGVTSELGNPAHINMAGSENFVSSKCSQINSGNDSKSIRLDISFKSPSHTGLQTTELVKELTDQFPAATPLALVLKKFLADRSLDQSYSGGLSSYCLVIMIIRFLQHEHHLGRSINQNFGSLLMDFLYFFGSG